jgi:hypothetical protein
MKTFTRRSALVATAAVSVAAVAPAAAQTMDTAGPTQAGKDTTIAPGVVMRVYNEGPAIIPGFKSVRLLDFIMQPGSKTGADPMPNPMVCHMYQGQLRVVQDGKESTKKQNDVWTCNTGTHEQAFNDTKAVAVMRMTFLLPA